MPTPQNGQTHSNNSSPICRRIVWVYLTILWSWRLKGQVKIIIYENISLRQHSFDLAHSCNFKSYRGIPRVNSNRFDRKHFFFAFCHFIVSSSVPGLRNNKLRKLEISLSLFRIFHPINGFIAPTVRRFNQTDTC